MNKKHQWGVIGYVLGALTGGILVGIVKRVLGRA
jgi:hypothetical protein